MNDTILLKLDALQERYDELQYLLGDSAVISDQEKLKMLSKEFSQLEEIVSIFSEYKKNIEDIESSKELLNDPEMADLAKDDLLLLEEKNVFLTKELQILLLPKDPKDDNDIFLEIRAGAGGDEAAIFVGDLLRMYTKYAEKKKWQVEIVSVNDSEQGGYKEVIAKFSGQSVYGTMKFESGGHRVQRIPETESQGRVHTSACTVVVMPEIPEAQAVEINSADLRIDTFRASGAGGQHVNKTDSAIRITHIPSGIVVECQDQRSQHKNKARAMSVLQARLQTVEDDKRKAEESSTRKSLVASGDRSERVRTYNYPQSRVSDHRLNLTLYRLNEVLEGELDLLIIPLMQEHQADLLALLSE